MNNRKKHFAKLRAEKIRRKPPTKSQKRNLMSTYLKNMAGYKQNQLKRKSYKEIQKLFDREMKRVNSFIPMDMDLEVVKGSESRTEESSKRARDDLESDMTKKQKVDEHVETKKDDDQEEDQMKKHMKIVIDEEVAIDVIPLATKPPMIVEYKIVREGMMGHFQLIRADGSSKRPEEDYERVLWGDLNVMFEPDVESRVWRDLQGYNVIYPLTPATITMMFDKKLQADNLNEMCYQLLKLLTKQQKNPGSV
ncbi:hypothetical protein Tco_0038302 [Tanacetum coccineum]